MERVQSLINRLSVQLQAKASVAEMLATAELLRCELLRFADTVPVSVKESVAVWLPAGYSRAQQASVLPAGVNTYAGIVKEEKPVEPVTEKVAEKQAPIAPQVPRVPVPPPQIIAGTRPEPEPVNAIEQKQEETPKPKPLFFQLHLTDEEPEPVISARAAIQAEPTPKAPEPQPSSKTPETQPVKEAVKPFPQYPDAATLMKNIFPLSAPPVPPSKEINELVVDPAVALNERLQQKKVEIGDVLAAGPKITDLRKAISINDKYQMISSLFRNDEDMFERSIRTLNNFGSLPEARFWMQRELVVKLGWNDNDEMVQHFYKLVSRRFA